VLLVLQKYMFASAVSTELSKVVQFFVCIDPVSKKQLEGRFI
jgi:hypothetical protein